MLVRLLISALTCTLAYASTANLALAGSIFLTGHDPDFHAFEGGNAIGAQHINQRAIAFIQDPGFNPFLVTAPRFLFVEGDIAAPGGHVDGRLGLTASGYIQGVNYDIASAATLNAALDKLGTTGGYSAIVVASDFGGILTQAELNILNARSSDIISFLNAGGGLYAMAEGDGGAHLTPGGGWFNFLPFIVTSAALDQGESGFTVTPYGMSLGLVNSDINGNASHNIFTGTGGMTPVDLDAAGDIMSLATRSLITPIGVVPEPATLVLFGIGLAGLGFSSRRNRKSKG